MSKILHEKYMINISYVMAECNDWNVAKEIGGSLIRVARHKPEYFNQTKKVYLSAIKNKQGDIKCPTI